MSTQTTEAVIARAQAAPEHSMDNWAYSMPLIPGDNFILCRNAHVWLEKAHHATKGKVEIGDSTAKLDVQYINETPKITDEFEIDLDRSDFVTFNEGMWGWIRLIRPDGVKIEVSGVRRPLLTSKERRFLNAIRAAVETAAPHWYPEAYRHEVSPETQARWQRQAVYELDQYGCFPRLQDSPIDERDARFVLRWLCEKFNQGNYSELTAYLIEIGAL